MPTSKCFLRYNNSGNRYKVCIDPTRKDAPDKVWDASMRKQGDKKAKEPLITTEEYIEKVVGKGKGYTDLKTKEQRRGYHRIDMANRRQKQKLLEADAIKDLKKTQEELKEEFKKTVNDLKKQKASGVKLKKGQADKDLTMLISQAIQDFKDGKEVDEVKLKKLVGETKFNNQYKAFAQKQEDKIVKQLEAQEQKRELVRGNLAIKLNRIRQRIKEDAEKNKVKDLKKIRLARNRELDKVGYDVLKFLEEANKKRKGIPKKALDKLFDAKINKEGLEIQGNTYKDFEYAGDVKVGTAIDKNKIVKRQIERAIANNNRFLSNNNKPPQK